MGKSIRYLPKFLLNMTSTRGMEINVKLTYTSLLSIRSQILTVGDEIYNRNPETMFSNYSSIILKVQYRKQKPTCDTSTKCTHYNNYHNEKQMFLIMHQYLQNGCKKHLIFLNYNETFICIARCPF